MKGETQLDRPTPAKGPRSTTRYSGVTREKSSGSTYTPPELADFVATQMLKEWEGGRSTTLRILDPAVGEGELLASLLAQLPEAPRVEVYGFDTDQRALRIAQKRLEGIHSQAELHIASGDFLNIACGDVQVGSLFEQDRESTSAFDLVIANPPYVRTQIMGADAARALAAQFGLTGRVDLYHAFILAIAKVTCPPNTEPS